MLLSAAALYGVPAADPVAGAFGALLLVPWRRLLARRPWPRAASAASLAVAVALAAALPGQGIAARAARAAMALALWLWSGRLAAARDHLFLAGIALLLVVVGAAAPPDPLLLPLLAAFAFAAVGALMAANLAGDGDRVRALARRGGEEASPLRDLPPEARAGIATLGFLVLSGALALSWLLPAAAARVRTWFEGEEAPAESVGQFDYGPDGKPLFRFPERLAAVPPFGPRLERDEFVRRLSLDVLAALVRPLDAEHVPPGGLLLRGECYDYLTAGGRWIRSRARETPRFDAEDGAADGRVSLVAPAGPSWSAQYAVGRSPDRTLLALVSPAIVPGVPAVAVDGTGNLLNRRPVSPMGLYAVTSALAEADDEALADPGPEFRLLPPRVDGVALAAEVAAARADSLRPADAVRAIVDHVRGCAIRLERDRSPGERGEEVPRHFDAESFFARRWGRSIDFATAAAVLLRSCGIPCRLATGYRGGTWVEAGGFFAVEAVDAYAWVEVPYEGLGWVAVDPSPPAITALSEEALADVLSGDPAHRVRAAREAVGDLLTPSPVQALVAAIDRAVSSVLPGDRESTGPGRFVAWLVVVAGGAALVRLAAWALGLAGRAVAGDRGGREPLPEFYRVLLAALRRAGLSPGPAETPLEFAAAAQEALRRAVPDVRSLTEAFCALRYGGRKLTPQASSSLAARARSAEEALRGTARRPSAPRRTVAVLLLLGVLLGPAAGGGDVGGLVAGLGSGDPGARRAARTALLDAGPAAVPALSAAVAGRADPVVAGRVAALVPLLASDDPSRREDAERALRELGAAARPALREAWRGAADEVRARLTGLLDSLRLDAEGTGPEGERRVRRHALCLLGALGAGPEAALMAQVGLFVPEDADAAVEGLAGLARRHPGPVADLLRTSEQGLLRVVAAALSRAGSRECRAALLARSADPDAEVRDVVGEALVDAAAVEDTENARLRLMAFEVEEGEAVLRGVLAACPGYPEAGVALADSLAARGDRAGALRVLDGLRLPAAERALRSAPLLAALGRAAEGGARLQRARDGARGRTDLLLAEAEAALAADPPDARGALGLAEAAAREAPLFAEPHGLAGRILGDFLDSPEAAVERFRRAFDLEGDEPGWMQAMRRYAGR